jgi:ribonuclease HI
LEADPNVTRAIIHSDGSCLGSGRNRPGGYAAIVACDGAERVILGRSPSTTSGEMELAGAIAGIEILSAGTCAIVHTDSQYLVDGATRLLPWWRSRRWRTVKGGRVANRHLWQHLADLLTDRPVQWIWLKGHAGDAGNERVHALAQAQAALAQRDLRAPPHSQLPISARLL